MSCPFSVGVQPGLRGWLIDGHQAWPMGNTRDKEKPPVTEIPMKSAQYSYNHRTFSCIDAHFHERYRKNRRLYKLLHEEEKVIGRIDFSLFQVQTGGFFCACSMK
jgi:cyanophycinase-like exopeptidase